MSAVNPQLVQIAGTTPTYNAASAGGDTFPTSDRTWIHVKNGSGGSITATLTTPGTVGGLAIADAAIAVPAGAERLIGPITPSLFGDTAAIAWSASASVTFAVLSI